MKYKVIFLKSPIPLPLSPFVHTWIVTIKNGKTTRWEVWESKTKRNESWGHVNKNLLNTKEGMNVFPWLNKLRYSGKEIASVEGKKAKKIIEFVERNVKNYPYKDKYKLFGPNSNTFTEWIIINSIKTNVKLPWNAIGKDYHDRHKQH